MPAAYLLPDNQKKLEKSNAILFKLLESCVICPRKCRVNRMKNEKGFCRTGFLPQVYSFMAHYGEEPAISGTKGSGTIFFSQCNMSCVYCQNYEFSQKEQGREVELKELAAIMLELQKMDCHNINLVTPTHILPQILKALTLAIPQGLTLPIVYNTGGYELPEIIKMLDGFVDVYLPDMRYADNIAAVRYSRALDYQQYNQAAVKEMFRQVKNYRFTPTGVIDRGLIIRHLVLPDNIAGTEKIMRFIAQELSPEVYISLMSQYFPCHKTDKFPELSRRISYEEYEKAQAILAQFGLSNGWIQESGGLRRFAGIHIKPSLSSDVQKNH